MTFPLQPLTGEGHNPPRFVPNSIVRYLLDSHPFADLNNLGAIPHFTDAEREQFAQLIGYSVGGFAELSYVSDETYAAVERMVDLFEAES